jgi:hypothetical protein
MRSPQTRPPSDSPVVSVSYVLNPTKTFVFGLGADEDEGNTVDERDAEFIVLSEFDNVLYP